MQKIIRSALPVPPNFATIMGYHYGRKWVAFYWSPAGDELEFYDGRFGGTADWFGWLRFVNHRVVRAAFAGFDFGSSENQATDWLLLNRKSRVFFAGPWRQVQQFLDAVEDDISTGQTVQIDDLHDLRTAALKAFNDGKTTGAFQRHVLNELAKRYAMANDLENWLDDLIAKI